MRVAPVAAVAFAALAVGCGAHHGAPDVKGKAFSSGLAHLRAHGWLVAVPSFPRIDGSLGDYRVVAERTTGRRTVTLKVDEEPVQKVTLVVVGTTPPPVPHFVGRTYRNASRAASRSAISVFVTRVRPLRPAMSADGIDSFVVVSQRRVDAHTIRVGLGERPCWKTAINDWLSDATASTRDAATARRSADFRETYPIRSFRSSSGDAARLRCRRRSRAARRSARRAPRRSASPRRPRRAAPRP